MTLAHRFRSGLVLAVAVALAGAGCGGGGSAAGGFDAETESGLTVCPGGPTVEGLDVSVYQGTIDWTAVKNAGKSFAIARVSDGLNHPDTQFAANWSGIKAVGMVRGVYQYFEPAQDPVAQANLLLQKTGALGAGDLAPVIDVETMGGLSASAVNAAVSQWISTIASATGRRPIVYSSPSFWSGLGNPTVAADLWIANWGVSCPSVPSAWSSWRLWQYSSTGTVAGISGSIDVDRFNGTLADLQAYAGGGGTPPPPGALANGDFEKGTLAGWTSAGTTAVVASPVHAGAWAARVGSTSPSLDSSIAQTFAAPAGSSQLSFWFTVVCGGMVAYDWASATIRDNATGVTTTLFAHTCANAGWKQVTFDLTASAGHSMTLTLASHDDNYPGDPTYTLYDDVVITGGAPPPGGITNGGFETGSLGGWTASGASTSTTTVAHAGTYGALLGSTAPTNGDSTIAQTFTVPAGKSVVGFYYANNCIDTVTYDWFEATLNDLTAGTSATIVAPVCAAAYQWTSASASVTAGHRYTLSLTNHDDDYAGDATYTVVDDVTLN